MVSGPLTIRPRRRRNGVRPTPQPHTSARIRCRGVVLGFENACLVSRTHAWCRGRMLGVADACLASRNDGSTAMARAGNACDVTAQTPRRSSASLGIAWVPSRAHDDQRKFPVDNLRPCAAFAPERHCQCVFIVAMPVLKLSRGTIVQGWCSQRRVRGRSRIETGTRQYRVRPDQHPYPAPSSNPSRATVIDRTAPVAIPTTPEQGRCTLPGRATPTG